MSIPKKTGFGSRRRTTEVVPALILGGHKVPTMFTFTFGLSGTQYGTTCEISVCNKDGEVIPAVHNLLIYLTDSATGVGVTASDPAGTVAAKTNSGVVLGTLTAKKALMVQTLATGKFTLEIIDDVTPVLLYVAATVPSCGTVNVSRKTVSGDYKP